MKGSENFTYQEQSNEYVVKLKKRNYWWLLLLLLLLLPLILLIPLSKDVAFKTIETSSKKGLAGSWVQFSYNKHSLISGTEKINYNDSTIAEGMVVFKSVKYTVYHALFFGSEKTEVFASNDCLMGDSIKPPFGSLSSSPTDINLVSASSDINFRLIDTDDNQPIPDGDVIATSPMKEGQWTKKSDAYGSAVIDGAPYCSALNVIGSKYGYMPDTLQVNDVKYALTNDSSRLLYLKPIKSMIKFQVCDLYSKQPVPSANAFLLFDNDTIKSTTNTDGVGKGAFENIHVIKKMKIKVTHIFYYDTITETVAVSDFIKKPDNERIIYIRPKTQSVVFKDVDGENRQPLEGVKNDVYINGANKGGFYSNSNGTFMISGVKPNDKITIHASKQAYGSNTTKISNKLANELNTDEQREIPLTKNPPPPPPVEDNKPRVNCRAHFTGTLISDFAIDGHISRIYQLDKYSEYVGDGEYPDNTKAFPNSVRTTFDGIAIDKGTRVIIYSEKNFMGRILIDVRGPAIINNVKWKGDSRLGDFINKTLEGALQSNFPPSCRKWSDSNMNDWSYGSVKVICDN